MRIAFLLHRFPGLSITFILDQITGLLTRGHEVTIYANERGRHPFVHPSVEEFKLLDRTIYVDSPSTNPLKAYAFGVPRLAAGLVRSPAKTLSSLNVARYGRHAYSLRLLYGVASLAEQGSYDILHCHFGPAGIKGALLKELGAFTGKVVTSFYGYDVTQYPKEHGPDVYRRHLFGRIDLVLALSDHMRGELLELGSMPESTDVHHIGTSLDAFSPGDRRNDQPDVIRVVTVARLAEKKGLEYAVRAIAGVTSSTPIQYRIVGDGPLRQPLEHLIDRLGQADRIRLIGWMDRPAVVKLLEDAHIFLLPSVTASDGDQEGTPTAIMEASAAGLPIVSTYHAGIPEIVINEHSGLLVPEQDVAALTAAIEKLAENPATRNRMGREGRNHIEQHFNIERLNDRLVERYESLL